MKTTETTTPTILAPLAVESINACYLFTDYLNSIATLYPVPGPTTLTTAELRERNKKYNKALSELIKLCTLSVIDLYRSE